MNHYKFIKQIAKHYGFRNQGLKLAEEASELASAMCKLLTGEVGRSAVIEEMADTMIMIEQMQYLMHIDNQTMKNALESKLNRQISRINSQNR